MKSPKRLFFAIFTLILISAAGSIYAQSSDRDNPTLLNSNEVSGSFIDHQRDNNKENYYSFTAGPGELTVVFDVQRRRMGDMASISFELLARNGSTALLCCEGAQSGDGGSGRETATVKLTRRQTVILHVTNASVGGGSFTARFSGAGMSSSGSTAGGNDGRDDNDSNQGGDRGSRGEQVSVPASGTLHIRMKNGTVQDINLSRIRDISVRP
jgi:hypothetical protein